MIEYLESILELQPEYAEITQIVWDQVGDWGYGSNES